MLIFYYHCVAADAHLAQRLTEQLRQHHPDAIVLAIGDGYSPAIDGAECIEGEHLKNRQDIHQYGARGLTLALAAAPAATHLIQLDPDCVCLRPVRPHPTADWFGRLVMRPYAPGQRIRAMHACCWGMRRKFAEALLEASPWQPEDYLHDGETRPDGSATEEIGFSLGVSRLLSHHEWRNWEALSILGIRPGYALCHSVKGEMPEQPALERRGMVQTIAH
jgi:hypothetical protein